MYADYKDHGLEIVAYPSNQFGCQEPGSHEEIIKFQTKYGVTFPVMEKARVND
jgi:glutathione peroxidase